MISNTKSALVLGSTGLIGRHLLQLLLESKKYLEIRTITRRSLDVQHEKLRNTVIEFDELASYEKEFEVNELFICLGSSMKKAKSKENFYKVNYTYVIEAAKIAKSKKVDKILVVSSMGADAESRMFYARVKGQMEDELRNMGLKSLVIFRPSLLLGKRSGLRLKKRMGEFIIKMVGFLMLGKVAAFQPIDAQKVAKAMFQQAQYNDSVILTYNSDEIGRIGRISL